MGAFEDGGDVEVEGAVGVDRLEVGGAEVGDRLVADLVSLSPAGVDSVLQISRRGQDAGVDNQGVAVGLGGLVVVMGVADGAAVGEEDKPAKVVEGLAPVELAADAPAEGLVGEPAQGVDGAQQLAGLERALASGCWREPAWRRAMSRAAETWPSLSDPPTRSRSSQCSSMRSILAWCSSSGPAFGQRL